MFLHGLAFGVPRKMPNLPKHRSNHTLALRLFTIALVAASMAPGCKPRRNVTATLEASSAAEQIPADWVASCGDTSKLPFIGIRAKETASAAGPDSPSLPEVPETLKGVCADCHSPGNDGTAERFIRDIANPSTYTSFLEGTSPEDSRLLRAITTKKMPPSGYDPLSAADINAVRTWVQSVQEQRKNYKSREQLITSNDVANCVAADIKRNPSAGRSAIYVTLHHLYNQANLSQHLGERAEKVEIMSLLRQGVAKLANSLSMSQSLARLRHPWSHLSEFQG
jgi:mono/diheme cytochrome c family protein